MALNNNFISQVKEDTKTTIINNFTYIAFGTDNTSPTSTDTGLGSEVIRKSRQEYVENSDSIILSGYLTTLEANGNTLEETGWFDASSGGNLQERDTTISYSKTSSKELWHDTEIKITITQS